MPVPEVDSLEELNERIAEIDAAEDNRILHGRLTTVGFNFAAESETLAPLPFEAFECGITLTPKADRTSRITVRQCHYSVPARFIGQSVRVLLLRGNELLVFDRREVVALHPRLTKRHDYRDELDHYLEILLVKPGAMAGSTALAAVRQSGAFTEAHEAFWSAARQAHGDAAGTRVLIEVLLLHRRMPAETVQLGLPTRTFCSAFIRNCSALRRSSGHRRKARPSTSACASATPTSGWWPRRTRGLGRRRGSCSASVSTTSTRRSAGWRRWAARSAAAPTTCRGDSTAPTSPVRGRAARGTAAGR